MTPIQININGRWILESVPELHELLKRPLRDGLGVFETMRMVDGMIPLLPRHYQRIRHSVTAWDYPLPDLPVPQSILSELKTQLAESPHLSSAKVRWGVIFQSGQLQQHSEFPLPCRFLEVIPGPAFAHFDATPLKLGVYTEKRKQSSTKAKHKLLHESVYEDAFTFAVSQGWDEAIVLNPTGQVIESANSNL
ncbi:MAG: aminotransferase class IV, partial [Bacteroidota bacterium]